MRRSLLPLVLLLVAPAALPAESLEAKSPAPGAAADRLLAAAYPADAPGAAVLVRWQGREVLRRGYGMAQMDLGIPVAPEQVFEIGSVTKQFTAAIVLRLAEQGKL